ncbi:MAG: HlyD family secretion protein [Prevotellaceae bacterium]|nr:HlyD family secretion protein [Prevotellaceae bacterium]MDO4932230.1 HlyD family secretion protein [Prevotellaceae bacterium]
MYRKTKIRIYNAIVIILLLSGITYVVSRFVHLGNVEFTDNAYIHQHITPINSRVSGFIKEIRFKEYTHVHKGDTLLTIEDSEFRLQVAQAEAALSNAIARHKASATNIQTIQSNIGVNDAAISECKVQLENARREDERYSRLLDRKSVTQQQYDNVHTAYLATKAHYEQLLRSRQSTSLTKSEQGHRLTQNDADIRVAQAALDLARLNLSYTVITAPCDGVLGRQIINTGQLVQPGQQLVDIVDSSNKWVVANFRETQMHHISTGNKVSITVDAIPGCHITGTVNSISDATGSAVSAMPVNNATGNFVKVEQRIPVRITLDDTSSEVYQRLCAGMSVECEVKY